MSSTSLRPLTLQQRNNLPPAASTPLPIPGERPALTPGQFFSSWLWEPLLTSLPLPCLPEGLFSNVRLFKESLASINCLMSLWFLKTKEQISCLIELLLNFSSHGKNPLSNPKKGWVHPALYHSTCAQGVTRTCSLCFRTWAQQW